MAESNIALEVINTETLRTSATYQVIFDHVRNVLVANGGTIKKDDMASGTIEGAWRYGINPFGLRVTIQFRTVADNQVELHVKGGFADAFDTTGAGKKKAQEIISLIRGESPSSASAMPPRLGEDQVQNRGKTKTIAGILALLLGGLGAHKFYLGNWGIGIVFFVSVFIVPYVSAVIGVIEAIRFFTLSESSFNEKYNYKNIQPFDVIW